MDYDDDDGELFSDIEDLDTVINERKPKDESYETFKLKSDPSDLIQEFRLNLLGRRLVQKNDGRLVEEQKKGIDSLVNPKGAEHIANYLRAFISTHTVQANIGKEEYRSIMHSSLIEFWCVMAEHFKEWDFKSKESLDYVFTQIKGLMRLFLTRPVDDGERKHNTESTREEIRRDLSPQKRSNNISESLASKAKKYFGGN